MRSLKYLALCVAFMLCFSAAAETTGFEYTVYYCEPEVRSLSGWQYVRGAENEGTILSMYSDTAEAALSVVSSSDYEDARALAEACVSGVSAYASVNEAPVYSDWYAPWSGTEAGVKTEYTYTFLGGTGDTQYHVALYIAVLNDDRFVTCELTDHSQDPAAAVSAFEGILPNLLNICSFEASGGESAYLSGAYESDGVVYITLTPFEVTTDESTGDYSIQTTGDVLNLAVDPDAVILLPVDGKNALLSEVAVSASDIQAFIDGNSAEGGKDCVVNVLKSNDEVRWMTYSYLY